MMLVAERIGSSKIPFAAGGTDGGQEKSIGVTCPPSRRSRDPKADGGRAGWIGETGSVMATVHARGVSLSFGAGPVLADVSFTVAPGQRIGVVGPNGTGKSTLLKVLAGQLSPEAGSVTAAPPTASIGLLPQEPDRDDGESVTGFIWRR